MHSKNLIRQALTVSLMFSLVWATVPPLAFAQANIPPGCTTPGDCDQITPSFQGINVKTNGLIDNQGALRFGEADGNGSNFVGIQAPASIATDVTLTLPSALGTNGQVLTTDASGNLTWTTPSSTTYLAGTGLTLVGTTFSVADNGVSGTKIALGSDAQGDTMYYDGTDWVRLPKGTAGQVLTINPGATAPVWSTLPGSAESVKKSITQTAHGFTVGNWIYLNGASYATADADSLATYNSVGVVTTVTDANTFTVTTDGYVTGLSGLTAGTLYYISGTAGAITATAPSNVKAVFIADSTTSGWVQQHGLASAATSIYSSDGSIPSATTRTVTVPSNSTLTINGGTQRYGVGAAGSLQFAHAFVETSNTTAQIYGGTTSPFSNASQRQIISAGNDKIVLQSNTQTYFLGDQAGGSLPTNKTTENTKNVVVNTANGRLHLETPISTFSALTDVDVTGSATGAMLYYNGTDWIDIALGSAGQVLQVNTGATAPEWATSAAGLTTVNGGVLFGSGTSVAQDAPNFFYDNTNDRLGIGNNAPASKIHITGDGFATPNNVGVRLDNTGASPRSFMIASRSDGSNSRFAISDETASAERVTLGTNGFLGIGTTGPGAKLHIRGDSNGDVNQASVRFENDGPSGRTWNVGTRGDGGTQRFYISDETGASERFGIDSSGKTWTGQGAAPQIIPGYGNAGLNVISIGGSDGMNLRGPGANNAVNIYNPTGGHTTLVAFITDDGGTGEKGRISYDSVLNVTNYVTSSDERLKTDTGRQAKGLEDLLKIKVRNYDWKSGGNTDGFFAQELYEVVPSAVSVGDDELNDDGNLKNPWSVDYGKLTPILVKAVQDLTARVEQLEAQCSAK